MSFVNDERLKDFKEQEDIKFKKLKNYVDDKAPDVTNSESIAAEGIVALDGVQNNPNGYTDAKGVKHETLASKIDKHGKGLVASENGVHGLRYDIENEKLIAIDENGTSYEIQTGGGGGAVDIGDVSGASVTQSEKNVVIKWSDPEDVILSDVTLAQWGGTLVVRKEGSAPTSKSDGVVIVNSKTKNQYASNGYVDSTDKEYGKTYYYRFFPYTTKNSYTDGNSINVTIARTVISSIPSQSGTITYNGSSKTPSWVNYDTNKMTIGGTTSGTNAGSYTATFTPKDGYCWSGGSTTAKSVIWTIEKADGNVTLSSNTITLEPGVLSQTVTVSGATGTVTVNSNDTSIATASISGSIITVNSVNSKSGNATITVSITESTNYNETTKTITVNAVFVPDGSTVTPIDDVSIWLRCGEQTVSYTTLAQVMADTTVLGNLMRSENAMKYLARSTGFATEGCANESFMQQLGASPYLDDTVLNSALWESTIKASPYRSYVLPSQVVPYSTASDDDLAAMISGYYTGKITLDEIKTKNPIGSKRKIHLNSMDAIGVSESHHADDYYFVIIGINHDELTTPINGITKALFTVQTERVLYKDTTTESSAHQYSVSEEFGYMNETNTTAGGWESCARRTWCNNVFINSLPTLIHNLVKMVNKKTIAEYNDTSIKVTSDKAFLISGYELYGTDNPWYFSGEGTQYEYFKITNNQIKKPSQGGNVTLYWFLRGICAYANYGTGNFSIVNRDNTPNADAAKRPLGIAPTFCM